MRTPSFLSDDLRKFLLQSRIATLPELKQALGSAIDITVFRKLKELSYRTRYSHRGRYYTLDEIPRFDSNGLWSFHSVWFSRHLGGNLGDVRPERHPELFRRQVATDLAHGG